MISAATVPGSDGRITDLTVQTRSLDAPVHVNVMVPSGYDPSGNTRYPVLYLLHGGANGYRSWVNLGQVQRVVDAATKKHDLPPFIVVMPEAGAQGWYTDWYGTDLDGHTPNPPPAWETFHVGELIPWIDENYPTVPERTGRAVAGLSMGGYGAMSYAAHRPDLFVAAASFSGAVDINHKYPVYPVATSEVVTAGGSGGPPHHCIWGDPFTQQVRWRAGDPTYLAENLEHLSLFVASGDGRPGPYDPQPHPVAVALEAGVWEQNKSFHQALNDAGVDHTADFYGAGTHQWAYWQRELGRFLPQMAGAFEHSPPAPPEVPFSYRSAADAFSAWDWEFRAGRDVTEFTYLSDVSSSGLRAVGSGTLSVVTASLYRPNSRWLVAQGTHERVVRADGGGRLRFEVDLGEPHTTQQYDFGPTETATWTSTEVTIREWDPRGGRTSTSYASRPSP